MLVEPICVAGQNPAAEGRQKQTVLFAFNERPLLCAQLVEHNAKRAAAQKGGFFSRLRAREEFVLARRTLGDRQERLSLRERQAIARRWVLLAQALQRGAQERQTDGIFPSPGVKVVGRRGCEAFPVAPRGFKNRSRSRPPFWKQRENLVHSHARQIFVALNGCHAPRLQI